MAKIKWYIWVVSLFACLSGFMFGYDIGSINGVKEMAGFRELFNLSVNSDRSNNSCPSDESVETEPFCSIKRYTQHNLEWPCVSPLQGLVVSVLSISGLLGSLLAGVLADRAGRKLTIIIGGFLYGIGGTFQCAAHFAWMIYVGRVISGLGVGIVFVVVPVYVAELSPKSLRGRLVANNYIMLAFGIFSGNIVNLIISRFSFGWRISLSIEAVTGLVYTAAMIFFPESPRWLIKTRKEKRAIKIMARVENCGEESVQEEVKEIVAALDESSSKNSPKMLLKDICRWKMIERIVIGLVLQFFNRFVGISVVMYYSVIVFCSIGVPGFTVAVVLSGVNFLSAAIGVPLVDKVGRKVLLLYGAVAMMLSMTLGASVLVGTGIEDGEESAAASYVATIAICLFSINYAFTWGPGTFIVSSEIYPQRIRGVAVSIATMAFWLGNFLHGQITPILLASPLMIFGTLYLLAGVHVIAFFFTLFTLPETKGQSLEGVEELFSRPWLERVNLSYYLRCGWCRCQQVCGTRQRTMEFQEYEKSIQHSNGVAMVTITTANGSS